VNDSCLSRPLRSVGTEKQNANVLEVQAKESGPYIQLGSGFWLLVFTHRACSGRNQRVCSRSTGFPPTMWTR